MYEFSPVTDRIMRLREQIRDRVVHNDAARAEIVTESYKKYYTYPPMIKRSLAFKELCAQIPLYIGDDEVIVGSKGDSVFSNPSYCESVPDWIIEPIRAGEWRLEDDGMYHNPPGEEVKFCIRPDEVDILEKIAPFWEDKRPTVYADAWQPEFLQELRRLNVSSYADGGMGLTSLPAGHLVAGYPVVINRGYAALKKQAGDWIAEHRGNLMGEDVNRNMFYQSIVYTCEGAITLVKRYAGAVKEKAAQCADAARKAELEKMAGGLEWLSENPARSFWEACQGVMMYQVMIQIEGVLPGPALGRFDQYIWPYLKKDLDSGAITMPQAQEIVDAFFLKLNCYYSCGPAKLVDTSGIGNTYQHTTLGGVDPKTGEDATNPVTYMVLETVGRLKLHDPTISLRFNANSPDKLWDCAIETSKLVGGLPLYQNDEVIIPTLQKELGFELEDARDYGVIGCQEIVGCGTDYPAPNGMHPPHASIWWGSVMDMAINDGRNPFNNEQASLHTGFLYEMNSMEEVRAAVEKMGRYILKMFVSANNYAESFSQYYMPHPLLSLTIEGCMEKGRDVSNGGAKYNSYGGTATGLATVADSLTTIKYMCFDKKLCSTRELYDAFMANWEGYEPLRQRILSEVPHFGNNDPYADEEMKFVCDLYYNICRECYSCRSKVYKSGLYGASDHVAQGRITWATPDGRKFGQPIADAASPAQSRDKNGPACVFCSSLAYDNHHFADGIALNLRIHPSVLSEEGGKAKLRDMTKTYFKNGGLEVQYNVVDTETLRAAQAEPEKYRDLVVRIAGYSAYFVELGKDLQNDIIARNENKF